jgi:hypothetical protein
VSNPATVPALTKTDRERLAKLLGMLAPTMPGSGTTPRWRSKTAARARAELGARPQARVHCAAVAGDGPYSGARRVLLVMVASGPTKPAKPAGPKPTKKRRRRRPPRKTKSAPKVTGANDNLIAFRARFDSKSTARHYPGYANCTSQGRRC